MAIASSHLKKNSNDHPSCDQLGLTRWNRVLGGALFRQRYLKEHFQDSIRKKYFIRYL